jgi:alcohol dehydrogenase
MRAMVVGEVDAFGLGDRVEVGWHGGHGFKCDCCRRGDFINRESAKIFGTSADGGYPQRIVCAWFRAVLEMAS